MRVVMMSDLHLRGLDDPNQERLVGLLDQLEMDQLIVLGDLFHHWWGFQGAVVADYVPTCAALLRLKARGVSIVFVCGNHDFALGDFFVETLGAELRSAHRRELDGVPYLLAHGDEADRSLGYRLLSALLRGRGFAALMSLLGPSAGMSLLRRMAGASRARPAPVAALVAAQERWAAEQIRAGARVVVLGHSHALGERSLEGGQLFNLGDWRDGPVWLEVVNGSPRLHTSSFHPSSTNPPID